jgi:hypothetical protein
VYTPETFNMDAVRECILEMARAGSNYTTSCDLADVAIPAPVNAAGFYAEDPLSVTAPVFYSDEVHTPRANLKFLAVILITEFPNPREWFSEDLRLLLLDIALQDKGCALAVLRRYPNSLPQEYDLKARALLGSKLRTTSLGEEW